MAFVIYPAQLEVCLSESCNLSCSYCFLKSADNCKDNLSLWKIKRAINFLYDYPPPQKIISFSLAEPLMKFNLLKRALLYASKEAEGKGVKLKFYLTSNATLLNKERLRFFRENNVDIQVSLDGAKNCHDANRKFKDKKDSTFEIINKNLGYCGDLMPKALLTYTPHNFKSLLSNIQFIIGRGFNRLDFFPDLFAIWQRRQLQELKVIFSKFIDLYLSTLSKQGEVLHWGMLERLAEGRKCNKIILGCDGKFYICDKVLSLPSKQRGGYSVGNAESGIDFKKRISFFSRLHKDYLRIARGKCEKCAFKRYCFCPVGLYIYCVAMKKDFRKHFDSFCNISRIYIDAALKINSSCNRTN